MWGAGRYELPFGGQFDDEFATRAAPNGAFTRQFRGYPVSFIDRSDLENGDKIVLPPSALDTLTRLNISFPMLFKISSRGERTTHCGVQEFVAEEGHANLPYWLMQNLVIEEGSMITISNVTLPKGTFVKFQPQSSDFLKIANPKAVLEATLRTFTCLTKGDSIAISYNDRIYHIDVKEVAPGEAISIIDTDVNVEFEAPLDYVDPSTNVQQQNDTGNAGSVINGAGGVRGSGGMKIGSGDGEGEDVADKIKQRLEKFKKKLPQDDEDDSSSDEDGTPSNKPPPKPLFPGSGQALKARTGRSMTIPSTTAGGSAASTGAGGSSSSQAGQGADVNETEKEEKSSFVPFGGQGRSLR